MLELVPPSRPPRDFYIEDRMVKMANGFDGLSHVRLTWRRMWGMWILIHQETIRRM